MKTQLKNYIYQEFVGVGLVWAVDDMIYHFKNVFIKLSSIFGET